jgi:hypothetical protein
MTPKAWLIIGAELLLSLLLIYILLGQISSEKSGPTMPRRWLNSVRKPLTI